MLRNYGFIEKSVHTEEQLRRLQHKLFVVQFISVQGKSCISAGIMFSAHLRDWALNGFDMRRHAHVLRMEIKNRVNKLLEGKSNFQKQTLSAFKG